MRFAAVVDDPASVDAPESIAFAAGELWRRPGAVHGVRGFAAQNCDYQLLRQDGVEGGLVSRAVCWPGDCRLIRYSEQMCPAALDAGSS